MNDVDSFMKIVIVFMLIVLVIVVYRQYTEGFELSMPNINGKQQGKTQLITMINEGSDPKWAQTNGFLTRTVETDMSGKTTTRFDFQGNMTLIGGDLYNPDPTPGTPLSNCNAYGCYTLSVSNGLGQTITVGTLTRDPSNMYQLTQVVDGDVTELNLASVVFDNKTTVLSGQFSPCGNY